LTPNEKYKIWLKKKELTDQKVKEEKEKKTEKVKKNISSMKIKFLFVRKTQCAPFGQKLTRKITKTPANMN
jgi:hypothetical protein